MTDQPSIFAEQRLLLKWANDDLADAKKTWQRYVRSKPFKIYNKTVSKDDYHICAKLKADMPDHIRKLVHSCTNNFRHVLDQVVNAFSLRLEPSVKELHFPWAENRTELLTKLRRQYPKPEETYDLYASFKCYGEADGGDKHLRNLAKAINPAKHQLALAVKPVPAYGEVKGFVKAGVPIDGSITLADPGLLKDIGGEFTLAKVEKTPMRVDVTLTPDLVFAVPSHVEGEHVIELTGYALNRAKSIIDKMEEWIVQKGY